MRAAYPEMTDKELFERLGRGESEVADFLLEKYKPMVKRQARTLYLIGGENEDLIQEGMLGLWNAIREYDPRRAVSFRTYAETCIRNRLRSAIKAAARDKHSPLNDSVSFETPLFDGFAVHDVCGREYRCLENPEDTLISQEEVRERMNVLKGQLSGFEAKILGLYLEGLSYSEIAAEVKRSPKSVDNAVQRIRRKVAQHFSSGDVSES